jgi:hypothetical protein
MYGLSSGLVVPWLLCGVYEHSDCDEWSAPATLVRDLVARTKASLNLSILDRLVSHINHGINSNARTSGVYHEHT